MISNSQNYRMVRDRDGTVTAYLIEVDGVPVPVSKEVYQAYAQMERHERYQREREKGVLLSLAQTSLSLLYPNPEDAWIQEEDRAAQWQQLSQAKGILTQSQQQLYHLLFERELTLRACAKVLGISPATVLRRKQALLQTLTLQLKSYKTR